MLVENLGSRRLVVSGGASWASEPGTPMTPAAPADDSVARKRRRLWVVCMVAHPFCLGCASAFQLALELIEEPPVGALGDDLLRARLHDAALVQAQSVEADGVFVVVVAPLVVGYLFERLERVVVLLGIALVDEQPRCPRRIGGADVRCFEDGS